MSQSLASVQPSDAASPVFVSRLRLTNFRCYAQASLDLDARPVVLTGPNGAGKTNLLEAVSFLAPGRGLRSARLETIGRRNAPADQGWAVAATVDTPDTPVEIGTGYQPEAGTRRVVHIDRAPVKNQAALAEHLSAVWLTPQMDRLFIDGTSGRRRFLDRLVFGFDAAHAGRVSGYEHTLRERARLLRDGAPDPVWLDTLEEKMAERGVAIAAARREMAARLARLCARGTGPFPDAAIHVEGTVERWLDDGPALNAEERFRHALRDGRAQDSVAGGAGTGPHRSDLRVRHIAKDMPADQCSTGEQKALLIALVLAHARLLAAERGRAPLLLLDEVAAHLDLDRREALFDAIVALGMQVWFSGTDATLFESLNGNAQFCAVNDGTVAQKETFIPQRTGTS